MTRTLTPLASTGPLHLGHYLEALRPAAVAAAAARRPDEVLLVVADLHALVAGHDPARLATTALQQAAIAIATGADPRRCTLFVQSHVPEQRRMHCLLGALTGASEAQPTVRERSVRERSGGSGSRSASFTRQVLAAVDVLLYGITDVPVSQGRTEHLELARTLALRANREHGARLVVPRALHQPTVRGLRDSQDPTRSTGASTGVCTLGVLDSPDTLRRKVFGAVTDVESGPEAVRFDPVAKPGVADLLDVVAACTGVDPAYVARGIDSYEELKECTAQTVIQTLAPVREAARQVLDDRSTVLAALRTGAERARDLAVPVVEDLQGRLGQLAPVG